MHILHINRETIESFFSNKNEKNTFYDYFTKQLMGKCHISNINKSASAEAVRLVGPR